MATADWADQRVQGVELGQSASCSDVSELRNAGYQWDRGLKVKDSARKVRAVMAKRS